MNGWWIASIIALWVVVLFILVLCLVMFRQLGIMIMGTARGVNDSGIPAGRRVPDVELRTLEGDAWSTAGARGRPYIVWFGSPQCTECANVLPSLRSLSETGEARVVSFIFGSHADVAQYAAEAGLPSPVVPIDDRVANQFDVEATPFAYAVNADGVVLMRGLANAPERVIQFAEACAGHPIGEQVLVPVHTHSPITSQEGHRVPS